MRRRRFQKGSLQLRRHGKTKVWVLQFYDEQGSHRYHTLGTAAELATRGEAERRRDEFMRDVNARLGSLKGPTSLSDFITGVYLPFKRGRWKESTAGTSENRITYHIVKEIGRQPIEEFTPRTLQEFLSAKAGEGLSFSVVDHLRWDLSSIFEMAVAERVVTANPATALYTPRTVTRAQKRSMTSEQVNEAIAAVAMREQVIMQLAIFAGMRPGEILALQRRHISPDASSVRVEQRVYRGSIDTPKTDGSAREVAIPPRTAGSLKAWLDAAVTSNPEAFIFAGEGGRPLWRDTLLYDHIRPKLKPLGLEWVDFQVMRSTNATLGHQAKVDPKAASDQRGHGIGVSLDVYTRTPLKSKAAAARRLEDAVLTRKVVPIRKGA